jgi:hypothetical protein
MRISNMNTKARLTLNKSSRKNHVNYLCKDWLDKEKTEKFMTLVKIMSKELGGIVKAFKYIELSGSIQTDLYKQKISVDTAKKILTSFKKFKLERLQND